jgi:acyl transferase domain-containing protein
MSLVTTGMGSSAGILALVYFEVSSAKAVCDSYHRRRRHTISRMKSAFLFPGQGAQYVGMGAALAPSLPAAKALFDQTAVVLDSPTIAS